MRAGDDGFQSQWKYRCQRFFGRFNLPNEHCVWLRRNSSVAKTSAVGLGVPHEGNVALGSVTLYSAG